MYRVKPIPPIRGVHPHLPRQPQTRRKPKSKPSLGTSFEAILRQEQELLNRRMDKGYRNRKYR